MSWIKLENNLHDKPEVWQIAGALELDPDAVVGKLTRLWIWFDEQTEKGNAPSVTKALLDRQVGVTGFCDQVIAAGWLIEENGKISIPNFDRHNSETAKTRALTAKRAQKHRKKASRKSNADSVTEPLRGALPREEKNRDSSNSSRRARVDPGFKPDERDYQVLTGPGKAIPRYFIDQQVADFVAYWVEQGTERDDWHARFRAQVIKQWFNKPKGDDDGERRRDSEEDFSDVETKEGFLRTVG